MPAHECSLFCRRSSPQAPLAPPLPALALAAAEAHSQRAEAAPPDCRSQAAGTWLTRRPAVCHTQFELGPRRATARRTSLPPGKREEGQALGFASAALAPRSPFLPAPLAPVPLASC
eukprot:scaffold38244_cov30-Tisochrysis_lutea.AAC.8